MGRGNRYVMATAAVALVAVSPVLAGDRDPQDRRPHQIRRPPKPQEFQSVQLIVQEWRKLRP